MTNAREIAVVQSSWLVPHLVTGSEDEKTHAEYCRLRKLHVDGGLLRLGLVIDQLVDTFSNYTSRKHSFRRLFIETVSRL